MPENPAIQKHAHLGGQMLWYAIGLFVVAAGVWVLGRVVDSGTGAVQSVASHTTAEPRMTTRSTRAGVLTTWRSPITVAIAVIAIGISVASVVQVYRVGDSGAKAVWQGVGQ